MTKFKDVHHLYFGCKLIQVADILDSWESYDSDPPEKGSVAALCLIQSGDFQIYGGEDSECWPLGVKYDDGTYFLDYNLGAFKPILRPLTSMTDEEKVELQKKLGKNVFDLFFFKDIESSAPAFAWLLSKHFDLFNLIENGEAENAILFPS